MTRGSEENISLQWKTKRSVSPSQALTDGEAHLRIIIGARQKILIPLCNTRFLQQQIFAELIVH
jgi:hypothetical protein